MNPSSPHTSLAARGAFAGAALFVALIVTFSTIGAGQPSATTLLPMGVIGAAAHLVLLPVVAELPAPVWARAGGYARVAIDTMLNVASINGAAAQAGGSVRALGLLLAALLMVHAFVSPWVPAWVIYIPFVLVPVWLTVVGGCFARREVTSAP